MIIWDDFLNLVILFLIFLFVFIVFIVLYLPELFFRILLIILARYILFRDRLNISTRLDIAVSVGWNFNLSSRIVARYFWKFNNIYNFKPPIRDNDSLSYDSELCPDFWNLENIDNPNIVDSKNRNYLSQNLNPNLFKYHLKLFFPLL